jgi:hypothetical protein
VGGGGLCGLKHFRCPNIDNEIVMKMHPPHEPPPLPVPRRWGVLVPDGAVLPAVCIVTGRANIPLLCLQWQHKVNFQVRASFTFYISADEKARRDQEKDRLRMYLVSLGILGLGFFIGAAMLIMSNLDYLLPLLVVLVVGVGAYLVWRAYVIAPQARYFVARHYFFSRQIILTDLSAEMIRWLPEQLYPRY